MLHPFAFVRKGRLGEALAVHQHAIRPLRILRGGRRQAGGERDHAGRHQLEVGEAAVQDRQVRDHAIAVCGRDVTSLGLENPDFSRDLDRLVELADLQPHIEPELGVYRDVGVLLDIRLESRRLDADPVAPDN